MFSLNIFNFIIRNGTGQKLYNIMIALSHDYVRLSGRCYTDQSDVVYKLIKIIWK